MKKVTILLAICVLSVVGKQSSRGYSHTNGRPGCILPEELHIKWRNNFDPLRYWVCEELGQSAVSYVCPVEYMYHDPTECCIHWSRWVWTAPFDPITHG